MFEKRVGAHPMHRRYFAEDLIRLRRADEQRRYLASQRSGRVDANPHQVDAVIFALQRIPEGGCILADEVGLGKTIEAGLVIAQLRAEGAARILLVTPKPLLGQWQQELQALFGIETREVGSDPATCEGTGVFVVGRELAGSEHGARMLQGSGSFDLCVIDEAHEIFAGIHRRYDRRGGLKKNAPQARMAGRVKALLTGTPVLLLTATPIQNTLTELWGLVQYVEPTGTLLGDLPTFRAVFCRGDDRQLAEGQEEELRTRVAQICQRTLRRQAQEYMECKFVRRFARLFEYTMSPEERALYDDVTAYLLEPDLCAFRGNFRRLLVIGFHRRMASSIRALAASLDNVAERLRRQIRGDDEDTLHLFEADLEDDDDDAGERSRDDDEGPPPGTEKLRAELARVEAFVDRARGLSFDSKAAALLEAVRYIKGRAQRGEGTGKLVIFTEALSTQDYLRELLLASEIVRDEDVTIFRGTNEGPRVRQALEHWEREVQGGAKPSSSASSHGVAVRLALVHEFETRSSIFIATEAGAKGLNLQFCENVVNYDLPWNPQRIEQRIGRCHRYGQRRDVTVINFLARDNAAQRLTFEILSRKLDLFGTVLDASDAVLHEATARSPEAIVGALGLDVEARLRKIYEQARTTEEIEAGLQVAGVELQAARARFESTHARTHGLIETRLDETVRAAFRRISDELPEALETFDRDLDGVLRRYLEAIECPYARREVEDDARGWAVRYEIAACARLPETYREGLTVEIGRAGSSREAQPLHLGHRLVHAAVEEARRATRAPFTVRLHPEPDCAAARYAGRRGWMHVLEIHHGGFEPVVRLLPVALIEGDVVPMHGDDALALFLCASTDVDELAPPLRIEPEAMQDALEEAMFVNQADDSAREQRRFEETLERLERFMADRILVLERQGAELEERRREAVARRDGAVGSQARSRAERDLAELDRERELLAAEIHRLRARDDEDYELWRLRAYERRYTVPRWGSMLELRFEVGLAGDGGEG
jgi:hypothetical protein